MVKMNERYNGKSGLRSGFFIARKGCAFIMKKWQIQVACKGVYCYKAEGCIVELYQNQCSNESMIVWILCFFPNLINLLVLY